MFINRTYYHLRPLIPRRLQISLRRQIVLRKYDSIRHIWPIDPEAGKPPEGWPGWPGGKKFALVLTHDVDTKRGLKNCYALMDLEKKLGFRSSFNFVPERYDVDSKVRHDLANNCFEVALHGLNHDGKLYLSKKIFKKRAIRINHYLKEWGSVGFHSPSMHRNLNWIHDLNIEYDQSTFDTDPFEPQPKGLGTIFPMWIHHNSNEKGYVELPYTLPQDFTLFVLLREKHIDIWKKKLDWIAEKGGMALLNTHPDYMNFDGKKSSMEEYPSQYYLELLAYVKGKYKDQYWHVLPKEIERFWVRDMVNKRNFGTPNSHHSKKREKRHPLRVNSARKIWIDLDNSPHVPFFSPIMKELDKRGYEVTVTARDCFQVCGLADLFKLSYRRIGRHYGKNKFLKVYGTLFRAFQLFPFALKERPILAVSHGSRSHLIAASMLRIPVVMITDYEHASGVGFVKADWLVLPEIIPESVIGLNKNHTLRYPGIKEDVYVTEFRPDPRFREELGLREEDLVVTIRPPATEAHYHNPESEKLFSTVVEFLGRNSDARLVILPRNEKKQTAWVKNTWSEWCNTGKIIIPDHVINGLDLIWYSDLVVSGGGTMNREAAALGVPVYSIFLGKIGAVDEHLSKTGRLTLIKTLEDVTRKIRPVRRHKPEIFHGADRRTLESIVNNIVEVLDKV